MTKSQLAIGQTNFTVDVVSAPWRRAAWPPPTTLAIGSHPHTSAPFFIGCAQM
jgi:hypothetical protein